MPLGKSLLWALAQSSSRKPCRARQGMSQALPGGAPISWKLQRKKKKNTPKQNIKKPFKPKITYIGTHICELEITLASGKHDQNLTMLMNDVLKSIPPSVC